MTPEEIIRRCDEQIALLGDTASVGFRIPGRWGKTDTRRLWKGGPVGEIVNDFGDGTIYVMFSAVEVKNAVLKEIGVTVEPDRLHDARVKIAKARFSPERLVGESEAYGNDCPGGKCEM